MKEIKKISVKTISRTFGRLKDNSLTHYALIVDGIVTKPIINSAEEANIQVIVAKNFWTTETKIKLISL